MTIRSLTARRVARTGIAAALAMMTSGWLAASAVGQGTFFAVLNNSRSNGDSRNSVTYYDASDLNAGPMFTVFPGFERTGNDYLDLSAMDVDPLTGDIYLAEFDNTLSNGGVGPGQTMPYPVDTAGDLDIWKIPFSTVYNDWVTKYKGHDVRGEALINTSTSNGPTGTKNSLNLDYITYGPVDPSPPSGPAPLPGFDLSHSNQVTLPGAAVKVGEVKRNWNPNPSPFFPYSLNVINSETLFLIDDSSNTTPITDPSQEQASQDHEYRVLQKLAGDTADHTLDHLDGGFNNGASQFWQSKRVGLVALDIAGHSEPESSAFYKSPTGINGVWVTESDTTPTTKGDDIAFFQLDATNGYAGLGYRPFLNGAPSFALDNDPAGAGTTTNDGKADNIFVDSDSGDVLIIESGFGDTADGIGLGDMEPSVLRGHVNYDNGGMIEITSWDAKMTLAPNKTPGNVNLVRGQWTAWDSANDRMYFIMPGGDVPESPTFQIDMYVLDMKVGSPTFGQTFSYLELDDSYSLFLGDSFGDKTAVFTLAPTTDADFDNDGDVDGADLLIWQRNAVTATGKTNATGDANGDGAANAADLALWKGLFGTPAVAAVGTVPEPATLGMIALCGLSLAAARRRD